jgi:predicted nucleic acid-binding protein
VLKDVRLRFGHFHAAIAVAIAEQAEATQIYSEDLNVGQTIAGIKIVNPLTAA